MTSKNVVESRLLARIQRYCTASIPNISPTRFGIEAVNDPNLVSDLEQGRELRASTRKSIEEFLSKPPASREAPGSRERRKRR